MFSWKGSSRLLNLTKRSVVNLVIPTTDPSNINIVYHNNKNLIELESDRIIFMSSKQLELLSFFLIELSLVEYGMLKFSPSLLAAAAVYTAQCTLHGFKQWSRTCEWHTSYSEDQLLWVFVFYMSFIYDMYYMITWRITIVSNFLIANRECSSLMVGFHQKAATGKLTGVHRKFCTSKFGFIANCEPAKFLLQTQL